MQRKTKLSQFRLVRWVLQAPRAIKVTLGRRALKATEGIAARKGTKETLGRRDPQEQSALLVPLAARQFLGRLAAQEVLVQQSLRLHPHPVLRRAPRSQAEREMQRIEFGRELAALRAGRRGGDRRGEAREQEEGAAHGMVGVRCGSCGGAVRPRRKLTRR